MLWVRLLQEREESYRVRAGPSSRIPAYDPEKDPHCPLAQARVFNRYQQQRTSTAPSGTSRRRSLSSSSGTGGVSTTQDGAREAQGGRKQGRDRAGHG